MTSRKNKYHFLYSIPLALSIAACGGGDTTTGIGGAPSTSNKCQISNLNLSSGTTATLSKASDSLSATFTIDLTESTSIETSSNFENATADDWIEGVPVNQVLSSGSHQLVIPYDLNSPSKSNADRYSKFSITVNLPNNEACVANEVVNITLNP